MEGPITRAQARRIAELEELESQRANAQLDHELEVDADEAEIELSRMAATQLESELEAAADEAHRQQELELEREHQAAADEARRQWEIESVWNDAATQYRPTREGWKIMSWVMLVFGFFAAGAILRGALINYSAESNSTLLGPSSQERICKSLDYAASQMFDVGSAMGELLPSANYLKNVSNYFEPQLRLLAPAEINFPNKTSYLRTLRAYGEGLDEAGRDLSDVILQVEPGMRHTINYIDLAIAVLEAVHGDASGFWRFHKGRTGKAVTDVFQSIDTQLEVSTKLINKNIHQLNSTDQHRLAYLEHYSEVRESLQEGFAERGHWFKEWRVFHPLHQAVGSVVYLQYPTDDLLAVLQCSYYRLTLLQPQLWPNRRSRDSLYMQGHTIDSHDDLPAILESLREARNALDLISGALRHIAGLQEELFRKLKTPVSWGGGGTIPIPTVWDALHRAANEARKEFPGIEGGTHHANDKSD